LVCLGEYIVWWTDFENLQWK